MRLTNEFDYVANDFNDLCTIIEQLEHITLLYSVGMATQSTLWYRGQANSEWEIIPGIQRFERASSEHLLCHSFYHGVSQINSSPIPKHSYDQWISLMQHYGLPTRLLDWSYSPLIALYFAVDNYENYTDTNASITVLVPEFLNKVQEFDPFIYPIDSRTALKMLEPAFYERSVISDKILACFSTSNDLRQYAQRAGFTIHDSSKNIREICDNKSLYTIIIPKSRKKYFKKFLYSLGIREDFLFPDISHVAKQAIKRHLETNSK